MNTTESIELCRGDHGEMTPRLMADADLLRFGLGTTLLKSGTFGSYTESQGFRAVETPDEQLLRADAVWQSDEIWE